MTAQKKLIETFIFKKLDHSKICIEIDKNFDECKRIINRMKIYINLNQYKCVKEINLLYEMCTNEFNEILLKYQKEKEKLATSIFAQKYYLTGNYFNLENIKTDFQYKFDDKG